MTNVIKVSEFKAAVENGLKKKQLSEKFQIPQSEVGKILKKLNLRIKSTRHNAYELVDDEGLDIENDVQKIQNETHFDVSESVSQLSN
jgi:arginine repressor